MQMKKLIPDDWQPTPELTQSINTKLNNEVNHESETDQFINYHLSKGNKFADIERAYRNWCRKSVEYAKARESRTAFNGYFQSGKDRSESSFFAGVFDRISSE
jgi:uncharacterized protein YgiM (DUF1202 family)